MSLYPTTYIGLVKCITVETYNLNDLCNKKKSVFDLILLAAANNNREDEKTKIRHKIQI